MKVGLLWPDYWPYVRRGTERMLHDIAHYLSDRGHDVHIVASKPGRATQVRQGPITIHRLGQVDHPMLRFYSQRLGRLTYRFDLHGFQAFPVLARERFDLIHAFSFVHAPSLWLLSKLHKTPFLFHVVMIPPHWSRPLDRGLTRWCIHNASGIRVFSSFCAEYMAEHYGVHSNPIPPTVDFAQFRPLASRSTSSPRILFTADLVQPKKGPHILALAFGDIRKSFPSAVLQLAGPVGFHPPAVKQLLQLIAPDARSSVEMLGPGSLRNLPRLYSEASVTVLPSLEEPFGMVLTESLACGTPVVGSKSGAIPEIVTDPQIGTLFERSQDDLRSAKNLAEATIHSLELASQNGIAERCRTHAQRWTWDRVGENFDRWQSSALDESSSASGAYA